MPRLEASAAPGRGVKPLPQDLKTPLGQASAYPVSRYCRLRNTRGPLAWLAESAVSFARKMRSAAILPSLVK